MRNFGDPAETLSGEVGRTARVCIMRKSQTAGVRRSESDLFCLLKVLSGQIDDERDFSELSSDVTVQVTQVRSRAKFHIPLIRSNYAASPAVAFSQCNRRYPVFLRGRNRLPVEGGWIRNSRPNGRFE
ncbi:Hypothetical protein CINCED_3A002065 [Cinara cedri]|uniref:Uncharacterized protein n=1 Tax=Cinara cedri TaxID=506608 RepID=A0A5E4N9J3_9HEMI|nr:Hypothetical protein CINCED_3A002065 [Cinara cedri]